MNNPITYYLEIDNFIVNISDSAHFLFSLTKHGKYTKDITQEYDSRIYFATGRTTLNKFVAIKALTNEDLLDKSILYQLLDIAKHQDLDLKTLTFKTATGKVV